MRDMRMRDVRMRDVRLRDEGHEDEAEGREDEGPPAVKAVPSVDLQHDAGSQLPPREGVGVSWAGKSIRSPCMHSRQASRATYQHTSTADTLQH